MSTGTVDNTNTSWKSRLRGDGAFAGTISSLAGGTAVWISVGFLPGVAVSISIFSAFSFLDAWFRILVIKLSK